MPKGKAKAKKSSAKELNNSKLKQKQLTQLHFALDTSVLRTCSICSLTYTRGAPDDESLHRAHCARVQKGMEWGKEEEREAKNGKVHVEEVASDVKLKNGAKGRIICFRADVGGKIGSKVSRLPRRSRYDDGSADPIDHAALNTTRYDQHNSVGTRDDTGELASGESLSLPTSYTKHPHVIRERTSREDHWLCHCAAHFHCHGDSSAKRV